LTTHHPARPWGYALLAAATAMALAAVLAVFLRTDDGDTSVDQPVSGDRATAAPASAGRWVGSWSTAPSSYEPGAPAGYPRTTIRNVVHVSVGGVSTRIHLTNVYGDRPLEISHATVAVAAAPGSPNAAAGTMRLLTFGGRPTVVIAPGRAATSDPVRLRVPDACDLLVTTYSPVPSGSVTYHPFTRQTSYLARGDHAGDVLGSAFTEQTPYWRYLSAVDVWTRGARGAVVALGDSITDGITSTPDADHRWTDFLAGRLLAGRGTPRLGVLNQGISGNQILTDAPLVSAYRGPSALHRLDLALSHSGVTAVVVELGINDIALPPQQTDPDRVVAGLREITRRAHAHGLHVIGATLMPFGGHLGWTPRMEAVRRAVNARIRAGGVFDAVVDFDRALRDPARPDRLRPVYDSGDHLHPSDAGYQAMADALDLRSLNATAPAAA
jgi:lysophospholipase L1-like esterase